MSSGTLYDGGLRVTPQMQALISKPGYLRALKDGGQTLRECIYNESVYLDETKLSPLAHSLYFGYLEKVKSAFENGEVEDPAGTETPWRYGYATCVILGAQRVTGGPPGTMKHLETLEFIFSKDVPPDVAGIDGYTAFQHAMTLNQEQFELARCLLRHGANVNHRNKYGAVALLSALMYRSHTTVEFLLDNGADMDIPDADGISGRKLYRRCGPEVVATVTRCLAKNGGKGKGVAGATSTQAADSEQRCGNCGKSGDDFKRCSRCQAVHYCSPECQKKAWTAHKKKCKAP